MTSKIFLDCVVLVSGIYFIFGSFVLNTKNLISTLVFKFIPFCLGCGLIFSFLKTIGFI